MLKSDIKVCMKCRALSTIYLLWLRHKFAVIFVAVHPFKRCTGGA